MKKNVWRARLLQQLLLLPQVQAVLMPPRPGRKVHLGKEVALDHRVHLLPRVATMTRDIVRDVDQDDMLIRRA